jgi:surfactin synthase thioesterase subunit
VHEGVLTRVRPAPDSRFRLFVLHHAGGSPQGYRAWVRHFPADWDVCLVEAPGRGRSSGAAPFTDARELARHLCDRLAPHLDRPFGLFGHSMGALVAYEMALRLADGPAPSWLGVSAWSPAPGIEWDHPRHRLGDERLRESVARMGGTPAAELDDPDQWRAAAPLIRADLSMVDTWRPRPGTPRLRHALTVLGGEDDRGMPPSRLAAWRDRAEGSVRTHIFPGGHFYFVGRLREVAARVTEDVRAALPLSS